MLFILLRGPAGSGKSIVSISLKNKIQNEKSINSYLLKLDEINKNVFENYMMKALDYECIIGEMFHGNEHTTQPETWISRFKEKNSNIFSFILKATRETCLERCINDNNKEIVSQNREKEQFSISFTIL